MPFLRADPRIRARGVDERDDRQTELVRQPHQPQRLAVAFRMGRTKIAQDVFLGLATFLRADDHDLVVVQPRQTADHRPVVAKQSVTVQFGEIVEGHLQIIQCVGSLGMAGQLHALPGG